MDIVNQLTVFTTDVTRNLLLAVVIFAVSMTLAAVNIVHFHHRRSRWQEALAVLVSAAVLVLFGLYAMNYTAYGYQVLFQAPSDAIETTGAYLAQSWLVNGSLIALAGASVCIFAGLLGMYSSFRKVAQPTLSVVHA
jgi:hypothetical protein